MKRLLEAAGILCAGVVLLAASAGAQAQIAKNVAGKSPWGPTDEIGTLNMMNDASRLDVLKQVAGGKVYDLGVEMFIGMPTCCVPFGDPNFQLLMPLPLSRTLPRNCCPTRVTACRCTRTRARTSIRSITSDCAERSGIRSTRMTRS